MRAALVLLRHARTAHNAAGRLQGQLDLPLDELGYAQARRVAPAVQALAPDLVLSSDLQRAIATVHCLGLRFETDPRLRELDLGRWQGLTLAEAAEAYPQEYRAWRANRDIARGGGETYAQVATRAWATIEPALGRCRNGPLVVVSHGGTLRAVAARLLGLPAERTWPLAGLRNCCWTRFEWSHSGWRLLEHGYDPVAGGREGRRVD